MSTELKVGILVGVLLIAIGAIYYSSSNNQESEKPLITMPDPQPQPAAQPIPAVKPEPVTPVVVKPAPAPKGEVGPLVPPSKDEAPAQSEPTVAVPQPREPEAVVPQPKPEPAKKARYYEVQVGDTLYDIAEIYYGHGRFSKDIYEANKSLIKNPDVLVVGWKLRIPYREEILEKQGL